MFSRNKRRNREKETVWVSLVFIFIATFSGIIIYFTPEIASTFGLDCERLKSVTETVVTPVLLFLVFFLFEKSVEKYQEEVKEEQ
ncbi:TPA: hypothetical protein U2C55_001951 [Streptococcus suis]|nr:hypothetical protein [Streptococcus suis]